LYFIQLFSAENPICSTALRPKSGDFYVGFNRKSNGWDDNLNKQQIQTYRIPVSGVDTSFNNFFVLNMNESQADFQITFYTYLASDYLFFKSAK